MSPVRQSEVDYIEDATTGCWVWQLHLTTKGYPHTGRRGYARAHRMYYEDLRGPIPEGHDLDHLCGNRACVNPDHLEPVTHLENVRRGRTAKVTVDQVAEIRESEESLAVLSDRYGICQSAVSHIRTGRNWKAAA